MSERLITIKPSDSVFSGHVLMVISRMPKYTPTETQIQGALDILIKEYPHCEITSEIFDSIQFIDQGQNFETVSCNLCKEELSIEFWQEKMNESYESSHFENMDFRTVCCKKVTNLNDLNYIGDCGFGSYCIAIINAEYDEKKEERLVKLLSVALDTNVKLFWKHI